MKIFKSKYVIGIIIVLAIIFYVLLFNKFNKPKTAEVSFGSSQTVKLSTEQDLPIYIDTSNETINTAEIYLKYNPDQVEVISASKEGSIFALWVTDSPAFSNSKGELSFAGGLPTPGFSGHGQIGSIKIKPKKTGEIIFEFDNKTRALKNDGLGNQISLRLDPISLKVVK